MEVSNKREKVMSDIFLDALPNTVQEWLSSPFVNQDQKDEFFHYLESIAPRKEVAQKRVKIGRNDPCSCGSGKKYKKCCLS